MMGSCLLIGRRRSVLCTALAWACAIAQCGVVAEDSIEAQAQALAEPAVSSGTLAGISVGLLLGRKARESEREQVVFALGNASDEPKRGCGSETIYEIGSVTKVFTGLLLADMVVRGEVKLDDPARKYLPEKVRMPSKGDKQITLVDLATHSSGFPRMPNNFKPKDPANPYADYDAERLYDFLNHYALRHEPGERNAYSNLGVGLLGHLLAQAAGVRYEKLIQERITRPLGIDDTKFELSARDKARLAVGHDSEGNPEHNWDLNVLAGAGGLRSDVPDLLKFLAAELSPAESPLREAIELSQQPRVRSQNPHAEIGLGWHITDRPLMLWHNGQTGGYHSFVGFRPKQQSAVVVLSNTASDAVDRLGRALLKLASGEQVEPLSWRAAAALAPEIIDRYLGRYELEAGTLTITREAEKVFAQLSQQPRARIWPASEREFFYRIVDAQLAFETDDSGKATGLVLHQNGRDLKGRKLE